MRLPLIKHITKFIQENDEDYILETLEVLENLSEAENLKEEEINVIAELLSNLSGAIEVYNSISNGESERDALNNFMKRVQGAIDK
tara:strand:+ start:325 stop:582 length:258 start_codon:yes stop_codon:yes gene_type:complete